MNDLGSILLSLCGLALVCGGLIAVGAFFVFRSAFGQIQDTIADDTDETDFIDSRRRDWERGGARDLRARRDALDFDSAVQRYRSGEPPSSPPSTPRASLNDDLGGELRGDRDSRRWRRKDDQEDELFGGMLGEDYEDDY